MGRRTESTEFLKECMADALFDLMKSKDLDKITIDELTKVAGVGRMTYFRHFHSKEEVLAHKFMALFERWGVEHPDAPFKSVRDAGFFCYCESVKPYLELICRQGVFSSFVDATIATYRLSEMPLEQQYERCVNAYAFFGLVRVWAENGFRESAEELARLSPLH